MEQQEQHFLFFEDNSAVGIFNTGKVLQTTEQQNDKPEMIDIPLHTSLSLSQEDLSQIQVTRQSGQDTSLFVEYRLLSATIVYQMGMFGLLAMDFGHKDGKVLQRSKSKLVNQPVMYDHLMNAHDWLGIISETHWTEEVNNVSIPGINGVLTLDIDPDPSHPSRRIVRGVELGVLNSFSVSVWFDYTRSHPDMDLYDFYEKMGQKGKDGEIIRLLVTDIKRYYEGSIVVAGADPHARRTFGNDADMPAVMGAFSQLSGWTFPKKGGTVMVKKEAHEVNEKQEVGLSAQAETNSADTEKEQKQTPLQSPLMDDVTEKMSKLLSEKNSLLQQVDDLSASLRDSQERVSQLEQVSQERLSLLEAKNTELEQAYEKLSQAEESFTDYKASVEPRLAFAELAEKTYRNDCVATYRKYISTLANEVPEDVIQNRVHAILNTMTIEDVLSHQAMWHGEFEAAYTPGRVSSEHTPSSKTENKDSHVESIAKVDESLL